MGEEFNCKYVLPDMDGHITILVVPSSLQMGWIESPPYFCVASETGWDIAEDYIVTPVGSLPKHKFLPHTQDSHEYNTLPRDQKWNKPSLKYLIKVCMDDYIGLAMATTQESLDHVANGIMCGIHDVFPP